MLHRYSPWYPVRWDMPLWCTPCDCSFCCELDARIRDMKVPQVGNGALPALDDWSPSETFKVCDSLNEVVCSPSWNEDVSKGERALFVFWDNAGSVRVILKVANPAVKLSTQARTVDDALAALEMCLEEADVPWQADDRPLKGPAKKKK